MDESEVLDTMWTALDCAADGMVTSLLPAGALGELEEKVLEHIREAQRLVENFGKDHAI